ncbi:MAG: homocysteine S-methyltransferase [Pyrinomonadaceae bacterium]|nr:homocysteine S-methyltransferase [Pyrinomonadaceae bacterium]
MGFAVLDGGLATELERKGFDLDHSLWSARLVLENPAAIRDVHLSYLEAGADIITTASYQASFPGCIALGIEEKQVVGLLKQTVEIGTAARGEFLRENSDRSKPLVAASVGPYGAYLANGAEYSGDYGISKDKLYDFHARRFEILANTESDLIACETIPSFEEAGVLLKLIDQTSKKQAYLSFSCKDDEHINDGTPIKDCAAMLADCENIFGIGVNCTAPGFVSGLIKQIKTGAPEKEVVVYPNSGETYDPVSKTWNGISIEKDFPALAQEWFQKGAKVIGGCCRTTPEHIFAIRETLSG